MYVSPPKGCDFCRTRTLPAPFPDTHSHTHAHRHTRTFHAQRSPCTRVWECLQAGVTRMDNKTTCVGPQHSEILVHVLEVPGPLGSLSAFLLDTQGGVRRGERHRKEKGVEIGEGMWITISRIKSWGTRGPATGLFGVAATELPLLRCHLARQKSRGGERQSTKHKTSTSNGLF